MEKKKPHYALSEVQRVVEERGVNAFTATALNGAVTLGAFLRAGCSCGAGAETEGYILEHDHEWRSQNLAGRLSRDTQDRLDGLHQGHIA